MDSTDFKGLVYSLDILTQRGALAIRYASRRSNVKSRTSDVTPPLAMRRAVNRRSGPVHTATPSLTWAELSTSRSRAL
jgi:hypothetical protein